MTKNNFISKIGLKNTLAIFQRVGYQILYGNYIHKEFNKLNTIIDYSKLKEAHGNNIADLHYWNVKYYRITNTEATSKIIFLNNNLEIICCIETIPEKRGFTYCN